MIGSACVVAEHNRSYLCVDLLRSNEGIAFHPGNYKLNTIIISYISQH